MLIDIAEVRTAGDHRLYLRFADGVEGEVDLDQIVRWEGIFAPQQDAKQFAQVRVDPELGTVVWPNGADLDPDVLRAALTGRSIDLTSPAPRR